MKKILFLITQSEMGGAQRFLLTLLSKLDQSRFMPIVAAGPAKDASNDLLKTIEKLGLQAIRIPHLIREIRPFKDLMAFMEVRKLLKAEKPDILFLLSSKAGFLGSLAGRIEKISKIIYRIGGFAFHEHVSTVKRWLYFLAEKISKKWKDLLIVNNRNDEAAALRLGYAPKKIRYIPNGVASSMRFLSREEARAFLKVYSSDLVIGTIANFYANKGLMDFLEAISLLPLLQSLPPLKVVIIGDGKERKELEYMIHEKGLSFVFLVGKIHDASQYLKAFDLFVLPSRKEGMPWVILEAMLSNVPIVATRVGGIPELLEDQEDAMLVPSRDPKALSEAIKKAISDASLRNILANHAKERVHRSFRVEDMVKACEECFENFIP